MSDEIDHDAKVLTAPLFQPRTLQVYVPPERHRYGHLTPYDKAPVGGLRDPMEAIDIINRFELRNPPFPLFWTAKAYESGIVVNLCAELFDRDSGDRYRQDFSMGINLPVPEEFLVAWFEQGLRGIFMHELEEALHFDGERIHDPHEAGRMELHQYNRAGYRR